MIRTMLTRAALLAGLLVLVACSLLAPRTLASRSHPQELPNGRPLCSDCHEQEVMKPSGPRYALFDHSPAFVKEHKHLARQSSETCASCHNRSSCAECHATKGVVSPGLSLANRPDRLSPHRGDYMTRHRIDGRMDPTSCFTCHGRGNNSLCLACHK